MSEHYPRVLVVSSDDIAADTGTGITLRNLFHDWPHDRLAQLHLTEPSGAGSDVARFRYPPSAVPLDHLARRATGGRRVAAVDGAPTIAAVPLGASASRSAVRHAALRAALDLSPVLPSRPARAFVDGFRPDLVYSLLGSVRVTRVASRVARRRGVPLVPHFMDDWPSTLYTSGELRGLARSRLEAELHRALRAAPLALCTSDQMCAEYAVRFGLPCHPFVNPVPVPDGPPTARADTGPVELVYVGGLHLGRWASLLLVAEALRGLDAPARLSVHAPAADLAAVDVPPELAAHLVLAGTLEPAAVPARLREADVLVHVESFDDATRRYTRLSLSTKVPQYLAAGRPVLAVGPPGLASLEVVGASGGGVVVTSEDAAAVETAVRGLAADPAERSRLGTIGRDYARTQFSEESVRRRLRTVLATAARG